MKIITSPKEIVLKNTDITCFLAGGITGCYKWQYEVMLELSKMPDTRNLVIFNPRQKEFDTRNKMASTSQIEWEFKYLNNMDIFSMYFVSGNRIQPICMYELGRYLEVMKNKYPQDYMDRIIVSIENGYCREQDVVMQSKLAIPDKDVVWRMADPHLHAKVIYRSYEMLKASKNI